MLFEIDFLRSSQIKTKLAVSQKRVSFQSPLLTILSLILLPEEYPNYRPGQEEEQTATPQHNPDKQQYTR